MRNSDFIGINLPPSAKCGKHTFLFGRVAVENFQSVFTESNISLENLNL